MNTDEQRHRLTSEQSNESEKSPQPFDISKPVSKDDPPYRAWWIVDADDGNLVPSDALCVAARFPGSLRMSPPTRASQCRRNAYYCQMLATDAISAPDRSCLMTMQRAWLALAQNEDWLSGTSAGEDMIKE